MINGGLATIFVSDFDRAVKFYTETLELKLVFRSGDFWAEISAGSGLTIGLHPASPSAAAPGTNGSTVVGMEVKEPIEQVVEKLRERGVRMSGELTNDDPVMIQNFLDPDGNEMYLFQVMHE
ncbi:MAG: VOC family protein [bacterium]|nr:VOC family protein [bacterium]